MIIHDLYFPCVSVIPDETNTPLVIDANRMLTLTAALKGFQPIAGGQPQVINLARRVNVPSSDTIVQEKSLLWKRLHMAVAEQHDAGAGKVNITIFSDRRRLYLRQ